VELGNQLRVEGVVHLRAVQDHRGQRAIPLDEYQVAHDQLPIASLNQQE